MPEKHTNTGITSADPEQRTQAEERWVSYQPYLLSKGYQLRPRYRPGWIPSWESSGMNVFDCEDRGDTPAIGSLDATRIRDNRQVIIKLVVPSSDTDDREGTEEVEILERFSKKPLKGDPHNHVVPCLETLPVPDTPKGAFVVTPLLSKYNNPEFWNLGEIHDFIEQLFEGLEFLHKHDVVHCDIASATVQMDGQQLYSEPFHPFYQSRALDGKRPIYPKYLRSQRPVRYYFVDFGYAKWFRDDSEPRTVVGCKAREITPEQEQGNPYDPFKADVYQLGAIIRRDLIPRIPTLAFLLPLARNMTHPDPSRRPSLAKARQSMNTHFAGLEGWRKRWPIIPPNVSLLHRCLFFFAGVTGEVMFFIRRIIRLIVPRG